MLNELHQGKVVTSHQRNKRYHKKRHKSTIVKTRRDKIKLTELSILMSNRKVRYIFKFKKERSKKHPDTAGA